MGNLLKYTLKPAESDTVKNRVSPVRFARKLDFKIDDFRYTEFQYEWRIWLSFTPDSTDSTEKTQKNGQNSNKNSEREFSNFVEDIFHLFQLDLAFRSVLIIKSGPVIFTV